MESINNFEGRETAKVRTITLRWQSSPDCEHAINQCNAYTLLCAISLPHLDMIGGIGCIRVGTGIATRGLDGTHLCHTQRNSSLRLIGEKEWLTLKNA